MICRSARIQESERKRLIKAVGMTKWRLALAHGVIAVLSITSLLCIAFDKEYWPFSQYPMFSSVSREDTLSALRLYGVSQEQPHREIPLLSPAYIEPFDKSRLGISLWRMESRKNLENRQKWLDKALRDRLKGYKTLRATGRHDGPPLQGVRLYEERWHLEASAQNAQRPDHRELITEVEQRRR